MNGPINGGSNDAIISPLLSKTELNYSGNENQNENNNNHLHALTSTADPNDVQDNTTHPPSLSPTSQPQNKTSRSILTNFILFSILFSANHGAVVSCISLASARLGDIGTTQNSVLYLSYTFSALFGSTLVIKSIGAYNSIVIGMLIYCIYVLSYVVAAVVPPASIVSSVSIIAGGFIGGIGGGFLWTAQGTYFARISEEYAKLKLHQSTSIASEAMSASGSGTETYRLQSEEKSYIKDATALCAGIFASIYLLEEVVLRLFSSFVLEVLNWTWEGVFTGYASIAVLSTILMRLIVNDVHTEQKGGQQQQLQVQNEHDFNENDVDREESDLQSFTQPQKESTFYKATITFQMLLNDPKMKYMIPINAVFGLCSVFIITFVNGEVLRISLNDDKSVYIGVLSSITSATAGIMSIVFGIISSRGVPNGLILVIGCLSFFMVAFLFIIIPDLEQWNLVLLIFVYAFQGIGRSTFEGALKAEFAVVFTEKEGAFGNVIFQNGSVTTIGFFLASHLYCKTESAYCIKYYADGLLHNVLIFEILIVLCAFLAILGYWRAKWIYKREQEPIVGGRRIEDIVL